MQSEVPFLQRLKTISGHHAARLAKLQASYPSRVTGKALQVCACKNTYHVMPEGKMLHDGSKTVTAAALSCLALPAIIHSC